MDNVFQIVLQGITKIWIENVFNVTHIVYNVQSPATIVPNVNNHTTH